jgi:hypothetical protein
VRHACPPDQRKEPLERLIGKGQAMARIKLCHARGKQIEHRALCIAEGTESARDFLHFLDVDGIARYALVPQRQVRNAQGAALSIDGRGNQAFDGPPFQHGARGDLCRGLPVNPLDQFKPAIDDSLGIFGPDRADIGRIHQPQFAWGERNHIGMGAASIRPTSARKSLFDRAVSARIRAIWVSASLASNTQTCADPAGATCGSATAAQRQRTARTARAERQAERAAGALGRQHGLV